MVFEEKILSMGATYWRHFEFLKTNSRIVISVLENPQIPNFMQIRAFLRKLVLPPIGAILNIEKLMADSESASPKTPGYQFWSISE